jgi:hypothetical protein
MHPRLQLAFLVLSATLACSALGKEPINEETLEAKASMLVLPSVADGVLVVQICSTCTAMSLQAGASTRYFLDKKSVSLKDLTDYVRLHGNAFAAVNYDEKTHALNRISVSLQ